ncbi:hypothetical protein AXW67_06870 [Bradyrhizobium neotropicale]|uniref:Uncharacterized protein n=1 Tax=Bradyrhizobium neotropicale TaxID=1497615 RepID=A0A176ZDI3_9BRAD|nr:hypothetical protein AXW67_06870 [Bradyrhizobium neotropicale]
MGALRPAIRSGQMFGGRGVRIGRDAGKRGLTRPRRCGGELDNGVWLRRLHDRDREAAVTMVPSECLVVAMPSMAVIEARGDLRAAGRAGYIDIMCTMQHAREQISDRDEDSQQPAPIAQVAKSRGLAAQKHEFTRFDVGLP